MQLNRLNRPFEKGTRCQPRRENKASIKPVLSHINQSLASGTGAQSRTPVDFINGRSERDVPRPTAEKE